MRTEERQNDGLSVERLEKQIEERQGIQVKFRNIQEGTHPIEIIRPAEILDIPAFDRGFLIANGTVTRSGNRLRFDLKVEVNGQFDCTRCLEPFERSISTDISIEFNPPELGQVVNEFTHNYDPAGKPYLDLYEDIRDALALAIPMKTLCKEDCKGICPGCGRDLNRQACICKNEPETDAWAALKGLHERFETHDEGNASRF